MAKKPLQTLYESLRASNYDVPDNYGSFERTLTAPGTQGVRNRQTLYKSLRDSGYDVPDTYESFSRTLFSPVKPTGGTAATGQSMFPADVEERRMRTRQTRETHPLNKSRARQRLQAQQQAIEAQQQRWDRENQEFKKDVARREQRLPGGMDRFEERAKEQLATGEAAPVPLAPNDEVVRGDIAFNQSTGRMEQTYTTPEGGTFFDRDAAQFDHSLQNMPEDEIEMLERERELIGMGILRRGRELDEEYENQSWWDRFLAGLGTDPEMGPGPRERMAEDDEELQSLLTAWRKNRNALRILYDERNNDMNSFWHNFGTTVANGYTFTGGRAELHDAQAILNSSKRMDEIQRKMKAGEKLSNVENAALSLANNTAWDNAIQAMYGDDYGAWATAGGAAVQSLEMMPEFIAGMPILKGMGTAAINLLTRNAAKGFGRFMLKGLGMTLGTMAGGAIMANTIQAERTLGKAAGKAAGSWWFGDDGEFMLGHYDGDQFVSGGESLAAALFHAEQEAIPEAASEGAGEFLPGIGQVLSKIGLSRIAKPLASLSGKGWYKTYQNMLRAAGWHGVGGEALEEYVGTLDGLIMGDVEGVKRLADPRTHFDIWLSCATLGPLLNAPVVLGSSMRGVYSPVAYHKLKAAVTRQDKIASFRLTEDRWAPWRDRIDNTPNEQMADLMVEIRDDQDLAPQEKKAIFDYVKALQGYRGWNLGEYIFGKDAEEDGDGKSEQEQQQSQEYSNGYETVTPEERRAAKDRLDVARARLENKGYSEQWMQWVESTPIDDVMSDLTERGLAGDTEAVTEYLNAKAAYDGMLARVNDNIDDEVAIAGETIAQRVAPENAGGDGMIHPAVLKGGREVFIISGNVATLADNSIDAENSDSMIIVRDAEGNEDTISPDKIESLGEVIDPAQQRQQAEQMIVDEQGQAAAAQIEGQLPFNVGARFTIYYQGAPHTYDVVDADENNVAVLVDGGSDPVVLTKQQLQQMADEEHAQQIQAQAAAADTVEEEPAAVEPEQPVEAPAVEETPAAPVVPEDNPTAAMPMDDQGEPAWDQVEPERGHQFLYQESGWPQAMADNFVQKRIDDAEKALKKAQDAGQKLIDNPKPTFSAQQQAVAENTAAQQAAQSALDYWKGVQGIQAAATAPVVEEAAPVVETPAEQEPTEQAAPVAETEAPVEPEAVEPVEETPAVETPAPVAENEMQPVEVEQPAEAAPAEPVAESAPQSDAIPEQENEEAEGADGGPLQELENLFDDVYLAASLYDRNVEIIPESVEVTEDGDIQGRLRIDGEDTDIWVAKSDKGIFEDAEGARVFVKVDLRRDVDIEDLAADYNKEFHKNYPTDPAPCKVAEEGDRIDFDDLEDAYQFYIEQPEHTQRVEALKAEAEARAKARNAEDVKYSIESQGEVPTGNKQKKFDIAEANNSGDPNEYVIFQGVYHDPSGYAISSDGHILVADKRAYDEKNKGKLIASKNVKKARETNSNPAITEPIEKGQPIPIERYPNWKSVKAGKEGTETAKVDFKKFADWVAGVEARMKEQWQQWKDEHPDEKMSFNSWRDHSRIQVMTPDGRVRWFKFGDMQVFARAAADQGSKTLRYYPNQSDRALQAESKNGFAMMMPMHIGSDYERLVDNPYRIEGGLNIDKDGSVFTYDMTMPGKTAGNHIELNYESGKDAESRAYIEEVMEREGWDEEAKSEFRKILDDAADLVSRMAQGFTRLREWNNKKLTDEQGNYNPLWRVWDKAVGWIPNRSSFKKNGEYPYNIDLGALCTKREAFDAVVRYIKEQGWGQNLGPTQIEALKSLLREHGFLTACDICFNETKRARALDYGNAVAYYWNAVRQAVGITDNLPIGTPRELTDEQMKILTELSKAKNGKAFSKYIPKAVRRTYETYTNTKGERKTREADKGLTPTMTAKVAKLFLQDPSLMGRFEGTTLLSTDSVDALVRQHPQTDIAEFIAGAWGSATPKPNEGFNIYDPLSWKQAYDNKRQRPAMDWFFNLGGFRAQSFSDYHPIFFYDYVQMFTDLAIRRLPIHIYTKVPALIKLFGGTGAKFNMSLVPEVVQGVDPEHLGLKPDGNGGWELAWHEDSFPVDEAFALRQDPRFNGNVGTIAVGISDAHIRMLLDDPRIDMVIPYHKSGMPKSVQIKTGLNNATDYTADQQTKGKKKGLKDFSFNEALRRLGDPRKAADEYLAWCKQNKCTPKFPQFADHPNYYKVLEDFRCIDNEGNYSPQQPVQVSFFDDVEQRLSESLEDRTMQEGLDTAIRGNDAITEGIKKIMSKPRLDGKIRDMMLARLKQVLGKDNVASLKQEDFFEELQKVYTDQMGAERAQQQVEVLRTSGGIVYGFAVGDRIVLNENYFNAETPMHEFTHVWVKVARLANPKMWAEGKELLKQTKEWQEVMNDEFYRDIQGDEDAVASEVLARIVGQDAARQVNEMFAPEDKPQERPGIYNKIKQWVNQFLDGVRSLFDSKAKGLTYDELVRMPMKALFDDAEAARFMEALQQVNEEDVDLSAEEERTLMGMHNISADNLRRALELGGFANPSMAVINTEFGGFDSYGEISLIPSKELIDSRTGKNAGTYTGDAYTPVFPRQLVRVPNGSERKYKSWLESHGVPEEIVEWAMDNYNKTPAPDVSPINWGNERGQIASASIAYAFLAERGLSDELVSYRTKGFKLNDAESTVMGLYPGLDNVGFKKLYATDAKFRERVSKAAKEYILKVFGNKNSRIMPKPFNRDPKRVSYDEWERMIDGWLSEKYSGDDGSLNATDALKWYNRSKKIWSESEHWLDEIKSLNNAVRRIESTDLKDEFDSWAKANMDGIGVGKYVQYTDNEGNTVYEPLSLESASRAMNTRARKGGNGISSVFSPGIIKAHLLDTMQSLEEIRNNKDRLVSGDEYGPVRDKAMRMTDRALRAFNNNDDLLVSALQSNDLKEWSKENNFGLDDWAISQLEELRETLMSMPTRYFETKFERPVMLDEFKKAVVPDDTPEDIRKALEDAGLEVVEYPAGDSAARERVTLDAVKGDQSIMFQIKSLGAPYQGSKGQIATRIVDALPSGRRFVDLFSGGGAVTHAAMLSGKYEGYRMNDINPAGQELFLAGMRGDYRDYQPRELTAEEFKAIKGTPEGLLLSYSGLGRNVDSDKESVARRLRRVQRLEELKPYADQVEPSNTDYREVQLQPGDVVYADIPYEGTNKTGYREGAKFDKQAFSDWALGQDVPIYVSEQSMPEGWVEVQSWDMKAMRGKTRGEKLFVQAKFAGDGGNATAHETDQTKSANFKRWFGDWENDPENASKVVDEEGEPLVMTHNTDQQFTIFDRGRIGSGQGQAYIGLGFNFSRGRNSTYGGNAMEVYLNARNPLQSDGHKLTASMVEQALRKIDEGQEDTTVAEFAGAFVPYGTPEYDRAVRKVARDFVRDYDDLSIYSSISVISSAKADTVIDAFKELGFDSTIERDSEGRIMNAVVFDPNQVKSATENNGDFDPNNDDIRFRDDDEVAERDREYREAVEKKDDAAAQKLVDDAAKAAGMATDESGKLIDLYHGTDRFGFTIFDRLKSRMGAFFTSTRRNVAANYAGDDHYAGVRKINKGYKQADSQEGILNNARSVFDQDWKMATEEQKEAIVTKVEADARKVTDEIEKRQAEVETLPADDELDIFNATAWVMDLFYTVAYAKENGNEGEDLYRLVSDGVERYNENKQVIRNYVSKHYDELDEKQKNYLNYLTGWDSGDVAIDIECSYKRVVSGKDLATVTGDSMLTLDELKKNTDEAHNIGAYHLFGNLGDNPLVVDAEGKNWYSLEYEGRKFDTDTLAQYAKENGYTALVVKNVYDYGDKADDYIFFEPSQLKSADPATYDDNGKLIPLSQRFDLGVDDMRFREILEDGGTLRVYQREGMGWQNVDEVNLREDEGEWVFNRTIPGRFESRDAALDALLAYSQQEGLQAHAEPGGSTYTLRRRLPKGQKWRVEGVPGEFDTQFSALDNARNFLQGHVFEVAEDGNSIEVLGAGSNLDNMQSGNKRAEERARKWRERTVANGRRRVEELGQRLGVKVTIVDDMSEQEREGMSKKKRRAKGWYDVRTGEVFINLGNHKTTSDIEATFLHEVVAHKGLRRLFGDEFDKFLHNVYYNVDASIREEINRLMAKNNWDYREATEEYLAKLAQQMDFERPDKYLKAWETVARLFRTLLQKMGLGNGMNLKDSDLRGILFESYHNMEKEGVAGLAESVEFRDWMEREANRRVDNATYQDNTNDTGAAAENSDSEYLDAVERGDMKTAEKMVKDAASRAMPDTKVVDEKGMPLVMWHGGSFGHPLDDFNPYIWYNEGAGGWFSSSESYANNYTRVDTEHAGPIKVYLNIRNPFDMGDVGRLIMDKGQPTEVFWDYVNRLGATEEEVRNLIDWFYVDDYEDGSAPAYAINRNKAFVDLLKAKGFDGAHTIEFGSDAYMITDPAQIKSAEAVTRDNDGNVIPLSERFNPENEDIRFRDDEDDLEDEEDFYEEELEEEAENAEDLGEEVDDSEAGASTFQEMMLGKMLQAANSAGAAQSARVSAMRSLGGALQQIRKAMSTQRNYDRETVNTIVRLAREVMASGYFNDLTRGEVKRLLAAAKNANGSANVTEQANKVVDTLLRHHLRECENLLKKQLKVKGSKENASGVEVQAGLDIEGQRMTTAMKQGIRLDEQGLSDRVADCLSRMGSSDPVVSSVAAQEYTGLMLAQQYHDTIKASRQEEQQMREEMSQAKAEFAARRDSLSPEELKRQRQDLKDYIAATEDAIRQNRMERADAYNQLSEMLGGGIASSMERAKQWREQQRERVGDIQHNANSDLEGVPADEHMKPTWKHRMANWAVVRFFMKPLATFDYMLRMMGQKSPNGEGYLWNRFMGGWVEANDNEWRNVKAAHHVLDEKVKEVFNADRPGLPKFKVKRWSDLFFIERKMEGMDVDFWDGDQIKRHTLTPGNLLYIYMVDKMSDGKMKLRKMGMSDADVEAIKNHLDPRLIELADWLQDEFLVQKRIEYNAVHERMFGAPMAAIENYFPLKINSRSRSQEEDVNNQDANPDDNRGSTITGAIIKRVRNNKALDVTGADAFDVILEHIQNMEHWAAFAEFNRDLNTLLSYKRFRNRILNMSSARFGSGKKLWTNFKRVCAIASGVYRPKVDYDSVDTNLVNVAKGVTRAKISFRFYTALKQLLSYPAYLSTANPIELIKSSNPVGAVKAWNWAIDNLPGFAERWQSRQAGDTRLKESDADWGLWKSKIIDTASRWGMSPNAFVDALTVAMGAKAIYETKFKQLKKLGYSDEQAKQRAQRDASVAYNETQQSSANAYTSAMQLDRTAASVALTVFRNASMGYQRRLFQSFANLKHMATKGYKEQSLYYLAKQMERDGLDIPTAKAAAEKVYNRALYQNIADVAIFGWVMQAAWNLGAYLPYLFMGDDDDDKKEMLTDAALHAIAGGIEGLTGGSVMSDTYNSIRSGEANMYSNELLPLLSDMESLKRTFKKDVIEGANDLVNLIIQAGVGVNPQTITDWVVAGLDVAKGDPRLANEFGLLVMRVMSAPQGQLDKIYIDELGLTAGEAKQLNAEEFAQRYARYKMGRESTFTGWAYSDEGRNDAFDRYVKNFDRKLKERIDAQDIETLADAYDRGDGHMKGLIEKAIKKKIAELDDTALQSMTSNNGNGKITKIVRSEINKRAKAKAAGMTPEEFSEFNKRVKASVANASDEELRDMYNQADTLARRIIRTALDESIDPEVGDPYKSPNKEYGRIYNRIKTADDMEEDILLAKAQKVAKAAGDDDLAKEIASARSELTEYRKELTGGAGDAQVMKELREARKELINEYVKSK